MFLQIYRNVRTSWYQYIGAVIYSVVVKATTFKAKAKTEAISSETKAERGQGQGNDHEAKAMTSKAEASHW